MHTRVAFLVLAIILAFVMFRGKTYEGYGVYKYATLGNTNFRGGDIETTVVDSVRECRERCNQLDAVCKGFTVTRGKGSDGKYTCWPKLDETIRPGNRTPDKTKTTYVRKDHWDYWKGQGLQAETTDETGRGCFNKVTIYSDENHKGSSAEYGCGLYPVFIGVSSIKIPRGLKVRVRGIQDGESFSSGWWTADVMNVGEGWNDKVKTIEVAAK
jgi:hypothetical protein